MHRFSYSVSELEVKQFVKVYAPIREFLNRYDADGVTYYEKAVGLARFFRWLHIVKNLELSPSEFLDLHLKKRNADSVEGRRWALSLALEYSRDNPDLAGKSLQYRYSAFFLPVKMFCDCNEVPLTTETGLFRKRGKRKYEDKPFTVEYIKRVLSLLNQRDKAICMVQLQSGQSIKQVLVDINLQCGRIFQDIDVGKQRIRFEFKERKGNSFKYESFISVDAIQEVQKWRPIRQEWLNERGITSPYLFVTKSGKPLTCKLFHNNFRLIMQRHGLYKDPYSVRRHGFRKFFEQEASPPERGISKSYISYMMGHSRGSGEDHKLDVVGGVYDNCPRVYPNVVEREYEKLEPYINIYSGKRGAEELDLSSEDIESLKQLLQMMKEGKVKLSS